MVKETFPEDGLLVLARKRPTPQQFQAARAGTWYRNPCLLAQFCFLDCHSITVLPGVCPGCQPVIIDKLFLSLDFVLWFLQQKYPYTDLQVNCSSTDLNWVQPRALLEAWLARLGWATVNETNVCSMWLLWVPC